MLDINRRMSRTEFYDKAWYGGSPYAAWNARWVPNSNTTYRGIIIAGKPDRRKVVNGFVDNFNQNYSNYLGLLDQKAANEALAASIAASQKRRVEDLTAKSKARISQLQTTSNQKVASINSKAKSDSLKISNKAKADAAKITRAGHVKMLLPRMVSPLSRLISCCLCFEYGTNTFDGSGSGLAVAWIAPARGSWAGSASAPARMNIRWDASAAATAQRVVGRVAYFSQLRARGALQRTTPPAQRTSCRPRTRE